MGYSVLLSNYRRYFKVANYLATFTRESIVIALGLPSLVVRTRLSAELFRMPTMMQATPWNVSPLAEVCSAQSCPCECGVIYSLVLQVISGEVVSLKVELLAGAVQGEALQGPRWRHPGGFWAPAEIRPQNLCLPHLGRQDWQGHHSRERPGVLVPHLASWHTQ